MEQPKFVDVHAHLSDAAFDIDRESLLKKLEGYIILNAGEEIEENERILNEGARHSNLLPCIGLHPNKLSHYDDADTDKALAYLDEKIPAAFAVSEIGLDYKLKDEKQMLIQRKVFSKILETAEKNNKVCIVHSRKSMDDTLDILGNFSVKAVLHNFEGNLAQLKKALDMGINPSISTGFIRFKKDNVIRAMKNDEFFVETDSPVLSPDQNRNTPMNIPLILEYISSIIGTKPIELKNSIYLSFCKMFYG